MNTACLPSCDNQFDHQFSNGTGVRCWVSRWGNGYGSFQHKVNILHKAHIPLVDSSRCNVALKKSLNSHGHSLHPRRGVGVHFTLSPIEMSAGAEIGWNACTVDGGSPLVCQAQSGRWTIMGLVTVALMCPGYTSGCLTLETGLMTTEHVE